MALADIEQYLIDGKKNVVILNISLIILVVKSKRCGYLTCVVAVGLETHLKLIESNPFLRNLRQLVSNLIGPWGYISKLVTSWQILRQLMLWYHKLKGSMERFSLLLRVNSGLK